MFIQNISNNPFFENICARLLPFEPELERLARDRQVFAFAAVGSIPAGYAQTQSDLDLIAFTEDQPKYLHIFDHGCISIREVSWDYLSRELGLCADISQAPLTLAILPQAILFLQPEKRESFLSNMQKITERCMAYFLGHLAGEIRFGQRRFKESTTADVCVSWKCVFGYSHFFTSLSNWTMALKMPRLRDAMSRGMTFREEGINLPAGWNADENGCWLLPAAPNSAIPFVTFAYSIIKSNIRRYKPPREIRHFYFRQAQYYYFSGKQPDNQTLYPKIYGLAKRNQLLFETCKMLLQKSVLNRYGVLAQAPDGWRYEGLGNLFWEYRGFSE